MLGEHKCTRLFEINFFIKCGAIVVSVARWASSLSFWLYLSINIALMARFFSELLAFGTGLLSTVRAFLDLATLSALGSSRRKVKRGLVVGWPN